VRPEPEFEGTIDGRLGGRQADTGELVTDFNVEAIDIFRGSQEFESLEGEADGFGKRRGRQERGEAGEEWFIVFGIVRGQGDLGIAEIVGKIGQEFQKPAVADELEDEGIGEGRHRRRGVSELVS
jgi:hypothetical protein